MASIAEERRLGDEVVEEALRGLPLVHDYETNKFVREMGERIVATLGSQPFEYEFFVVREDSINAFAVPGGKIFVHAGLISRASNEGELAGVLGHEVAHSHAHHAFRQQQKGQLANYTSLLGVFLGAINPVLAQAAMAAGMAQQLSYQREFEREADFLGIGYLEKAGYDPTAMLGMMQKLHTESQRNPTLMPPYFMSHPLTSERLSYMEATLKSNEWTAKKTAPSAEFERIQAIVRAYSQTRKEAVPDFEKRLTDAGASDRPRALELIGILMAHGDEYSTAVGHLEEARSAGRSVDRELGRSYLRLGKFEKAEPLLKRATEADPSDWNARADYGELLYQLQRYEAAIEHLDKAVEAYPYVPLTREVLARALNKADKTGAAYFHYGAAADFRGDARAALRYYKRAADDLPKDDPLREDLDEKIERLERVVSGPPTRPGARPPGFAGRDRVSGALP